MILVLPFLRAKLIRKEKISAISSQFMNPSRIYTKKKTDSSQSDESIKDFSITPLLQNSIQKRCCHFFQRKTKTNINLHEPKVPPKYWTFFAKTYHANDRDNNMSLFNNSSRQLRRITEQSISMLKVSQNGNTIQHLSFLPSKKQNISWSI